MLQGFLRPIFLLGKPHPLREVLHVAVLIIGTSHDAFNLLLTFFDINIHLISLVSNPLRVR